MQMMIMSPSGGNWCWYNFNPTPNPAWYPAGDLGPQFHSQGCITSPGRPPKPLSYYQSHGITVIGPPPTPVSTPQPGPKTGHHHPVKPPSGGSEWCYYQHIGVTGGGAGWYRPGANGYTSPYQCIKTIGKPGWVPAGAQPPPSGNGTFGSGIGILLAVMVVAALGLRGYAKKRGR